MSGVLETLWQRARDLAGAKPDQTMLSALSGIPDAPTNQKEKLAAIAALKARQQHGWQTIGQIPQGLVATTVANSARKKESGATVAGYRPAIVDSLPALYGVIKTLGHVAAPTLVDAPANGSLPANSMERMNVANTRTNDALGIHDPENAAQMALNVVGSLLLPGGEVNATTKLGKIGKAATELALPLRQGSLASASKTVVPVAVGLREGIDAVSDDQNYTGLADKSKTPEPTTDDYVDFFNEPDDPTDPLNDMIYEDNKTSNWEKAAVVLGAAGLAVGGAKVAQIAAKSAPFVPFNVISHKLERSVGGLPRKGVTSVVDSMRPIRSAANDSLTPNAAKNVNWRADAITSTAIGSQTKHFYTTGEAPFASKPYASPAKIVEKFSTELAPEEQQLVGNAMLYATSLDDFNRTKINASFSHIDPADKQAIIDSVKNNPKLAPHFELGQKSYKELLDYQVDTGVRSVAEASVFRAANPNYAHMSRDMSTDFKQDLFSSQFDAQDAARKVYERNVLEERSGVQDNARNPMHELPNQWAEAIRFGRVNDFRSNALEELHLSKAMNADSSAPLVRKLPLDEAPKSDSWDKIHTTYQDGQVVHYQVNDPMLGTAFKMQSRAAFKPLEAWRQLRQSFTTGPIGSLANGFMFTVSPLYETQLGQLLRPKGTHQGVINELLSKKGMSIGPLDPTQPFTAYTGAVRYMFDDMTQRLASHLTNALTTQNTPLRAMLSGNVTDIARTVLGDKNTTALRDALDQAYQSGIKAQGERIGAFSQTMHGSPDTLSVTQGLSDLAPDFTYQQGVNKFQQLMSNKAYAKGVWAGIQVPWLRARTSSFGQMVDLAQESMRNGFAYSNLAANRSRISNMDELASAVRRTSVDSSTHGSNPYINMLTGSIEYSNLGLQTFYEIARRAKESPLTFGTNAMITMGTLTALKYASMSDPEALERNNNKTPEQRARTLSLPMGVEMPIEQSFRPIWATMSTYFDHISGASAGLPNENFLQAFQNWFDHPEDKAAQEDLEDDRDRSLWAAVKANNPLAPESSAPAQLLLASEGLDPSMTALAGTPQAERTQTLSGIDADKTYVGSLMTAHHENMITTAFGSFMDHIVRTADEVYRASGYYKGPQDAWETAMGRWKDTAARGATINKPLFGQYESVQSVADVNFDLVKRRTLGIDAAMSVYNKDVRLDNLKDIPDPDLQQYVDSNMYQLRPEFANTPLQTIGVFTQMLNRQLRPLDKQVGALSKDKQRIDGNTQLPVEERNEGMNVITDKRKAINYQKIVAIRQTEEQIAQALGQDHFSYDGFDPKAYLPTESTPQ